MTRARAARFAAIAATTVALASVLARPAFAQSQTGRIEGTVLGSDGTPLAGAEVQARSPTQIGGVKRTTTDANGQFRFVGLTPGSFTVRASKAGLLPDERTGLWVSVNSTVTVTLFLAEAETAGEVYVVKTERPVVDVTRKSTGERVPQEFIERVPVLVRRPQSVTEFSPGVVQPPGTAGGNPNMRGGANFNNVYTVDGVDTTDPTTHTFGTNFNFDAISDVDVQTAGFGAEYGMVTGGVANLVTKSGSNEFHIDASLYHQDDHLTLKDPLEEGATFREDNINVNVSGPIVRDRLWYFVSVQYDDRVSSIPCNQGELGGLCPHPSLHRRGVLYLAKLTYQVSERHKLTFWTQGEVTGIDNQLQIPTTAPEAERHQDQQTQIGAISHDWIITPKVFLRSQVSVQRQRLEIFPQSGDRNSPGNLEDSITGIASGNFTRVTDDRRYRLTLQQTLTYFFDRQRFSMEPHLGYKLWYGQNPVSEAVPGNLTLRFADGEPGSQTVYCEDFHPELDRDDPDRCVEGTLDTTTRGLFASVFVDDALKPWKNLTVTPGVGYHYGITSNYRDDIITEFKTLTPHLNVIWDPWANGKTAVRAGYNQYVDIGFLSIPGFVGKSLFQETCDWDPAAGAYVANCGRLGGEQGVTVGHPQGANGPEEKLRPPRTHEFMAAIERQIVGNTSVGVELVHRRYNHLFEDRETNLIWNEQGTDIVESIDPKLPGQVVFDLETPDEAKRRYWSVSLTGHRFIGRWAFLGSYTWARSEGTVNEGFATVFLDNPTQTHYYDGFLPDDRRHTLKAFASVQALPSLSIGASFQYATGTPYNKLYFNDFYRAFNDFRAQRGSDPNNPNDPDDDTELRYPDLVELGAKVVFSFQRLTGQNIEAIGEIFNLLNTNTPTRIEERNLGEDAPVQFGDAIDRQDPLRARVGVRYRY